MATDDPADVLRLARLTVKEANQKAIRMQNQTTQQLVQRIKDLKYWSTEIDRELQELNDETTETKRQAQRVSTCLAVTGLAVKCNETCLAIRRKKVQIGEHQNQGDRVDVELHKEKELLAEGVKQIREMAAAAERQAEANEQAKKHLMRDWTLKQEAITLDHRSAAMANGSSSMNARTPDGLQLELRDGVPLQRMFEYQEWVETTAINLNNSAKNRVHSRKLLQKIVIGLRELAQQMRNEATAVEATLKDSCKIWQDWRDGLRLQLNARDKQLNLADAAIGEIQFALRQNQRGLRPGIELCNDKAQHALHAELATLKTSLLSLEHQLDRARESRKQLEGDRFRLERRLELAEQNLLVDNELLRAARAAYPTEIQQSGFLLSDAAQ